MVEFDWNEMDYMRDLLDHLYIKKIGPPYHSYPNNFSWIFILQKFKEENNINFEIILEGRSWPFGSRKMIKSILWESEEEYLAFRLRFHNICT